MFFIFQVSYSTIIRVEAGYCSCGEYSHSTFRPMEPFSPVAVWFISAHMICWGLAYNKIVFVLWLITSLCLIINLLNREGKFSGDYTFYAVSQYLTILQYSYISKLKNNITWIFNLCLCDSPSLSLSLHHINARIIQNYFRYFWIFDTFFVHLLEMRLGVLKQIRLASQQILKRARHHVTWESALSFSWVQ
jgi:hypothetical protein